MKPTMMTSFISKKTTVNYLKLKEIEQYERVEEFWDIYQFGNLIRVAKVALLLAHGNADRTAMEVKTLNDALYTELLASDIWRILLIFKLTIMKNWRDTNLTKCQSRCQ